MSIELKPCPFCGGEAYLRDFGAGFHRVCCWNRDCAMTCETPMRTSAEKAITDWNTRAERTCKNANEEWEKTSFAHAATSFCCSECGAHYVDCESYYAALAGADEEQIRTNYCPNCGAKVVG